MDDILAEFLTETTESLAVVDAELLKLERDPSNKDVLGHIFRLVHTIKGTCGFIGLPRLEKVAHASENMLGRFRDGELQVTPRKVTLILESIDRIKAILAEIELRESEPPGDDADLIARLDSAAGGADVEGDNASTIAPEPESEVAGNVAGFVDAAPRSEKGNEPGIANQSLRVSVEVIENLMTMVSELVLTRNQLLEMVRHNNDSEFKVPLQRLSNVTAELQDGVMKTRMQPIGNAWAKLPRIVRDLSNELGKKITLQMEGADTDLDRQVLELIKDPLTHMIRNSADHGIESIADRIAAGKSDTGTITLRAYHEGGHILIEVSDDGKGLPTDKIKAKAIANGLISEADAARMTPAQTHRLIFHAGLSTAAEVTKVSGRGVGMDVVRSNIELIGGSVDLRSEEGKGTTFIIKIPLTLAIVSALIVGVSDMRFAIPQICVVELVRVALGTEAQIERINNTPVLRLRDRLLPLVRLSEILRIEGALAPDAKKEAFIVVAQAGGRTFGIVVDSVFDTGEIVVKPVSPLLRDIPMFSGNTILGDGSVIMIIDPNGVAAAINATEARTRNDQQDEAPSVPDELAGKAQSLLVFRAGTQELKAIPLSLVTRLEEIDTGRVERSNGQAVVQYRGRLMPVVTVNETQALRDTGRQPILVFSEGDRTMGIAVDEIVDIVDAVLRVELSTSHPGLLGSAIVRGQATEILDVTYYAARVFGRFTAPVDQPKISKQVLLVDESAFFRALMVPLLSSIGYEVTEADTLDAAADLAKAGHTYDLILGDMQTLRAARQAERSLEIETVWPTTPLVMVAANPEQAAAPNSEVISKFDRDIVLRSIQSRLDTEERFVA